MTLQNRLRPSPNASACPPLSLTPTASVSRAILPRLCHLSDYRIGFYRQSCSVHSPDSLTKFNPIWSHYPDILRAIYSRFVLRLAISSDLRLRKHHASGPNPSPDLAFSVVDLPLPKYLWDFWCKDLQIGEDDLTNWM